jgi:hypothetical protein
MSGRGACNLQGGAIYAHGSVAIFEMISEIYATTGADVEIHDSTFKSNTASFVSYSNKKSETFPELSSLQFPAGDMPQSLTRHRSFTAARIGFNYTGIGKSALKFSFALLFSSIRAASAKRTISNFRSNSRRATCNLQGGAIYADGGDIFAIGNITQRSLATLIYDSVFIGNTAGNVSRFCSCYLAVL